MDLQKELRVWQARLAHSKANENGVWRLYDVEPSPILGHHIVRTINENYQPTVNTPVIFRYDDPSSPVALPKNGLKWQAPDNLFGFSRSTSFSGSVQFIYLDKVCDIFILDLFRPSDVIRDIHNTDLSYKGYFSETGVQLTFQLFRPERV